jgi:GTP cyclohydrolase II
MERRRSFASIPSASREMCSHPSVAIVGRNWNFRCAKYKLKAYELQDAGLDTVEANRQLGFAADARDYEFAAEALKALGLRAVRLLSNNPDKVEQLERAGIRVVKRIPCRPRTSRHSRAYLQTKKDKLGNLLAGI